MNKTQSRYPTDWPQIALAIKEREGWHCHRCGIQGLRPGDRLFSPKDRALLIQVHHWDWCDSLEYESRVLDDTGYGGSNDTFVGFPFGKAARTQIGKGVKQGCQQPIKKRH
jgi:hypothetical protein